MDLKTGKVFSFKLTDKRVSQIKQILVNLNVDEENLSATSIFDKIISSYFDKLEALANRPASEDREYTQEPQKVIQEVKPEFSEVNICIPESNIERKLSVFHNELINAIINNPQVIQDFSNMNKNGKLNGIFNPIDTENQETNILNLLTGVLTGSANGMILKKNVIPKDELKKRISNYVKSNNE